MMNDTKTIIISNYSKINVQCGKPIFRTINSDDFVIEPFGPGLGDTLWHSHLPKLAKKKGYRRVLISLDAEYRNNEYKNIIWELNPFVDGYCLRGRDNKYELPNLQHFLDKNSKKLNLLDYIMLYFELDDGLRFHKPELYYRPNRLEFLKESVIYDPNFVSNPRIEQESFALVRKYFVSKKIHFDYQLKPLHKNSINITNKDIAIGDYQQNIEIYNNFNYYLECGSFRDFCDVIFSAKKIYCFTTGTLVLADSLNQSCSILLTEDITYPIHSNMHNYINLKANYDGQNNS